MSLRKKKLVLAFVALSIVAIIVVVLIYQNKYAKTSDPAEIKGLWITKEVWQEEKLIYEGTNGTMLAVDTKGGYRFWDNGADHVGKLTKKDGRLHFTGEDGAAYSLFGQRGELIVSMKRGNDEQTWIFERQGDYHDTQLTDQQFAERYYALQKEAMQIKDQIYRGVYLVTKTKILQEVDEESAILAAREGIIEKAAYAWYAKKEGIVITDKEVETYMEDLISEVNKAEEFKEIDDIYRRVGLTFEESIRGQKELYRNICIMSKISEEHPTDWDAFKADLINQYKETKEYDALQTKLDDAAEKIKKKIHK